MQNHNDMISYSKFNVAIPRAFLGTEHTHFWGIFFLNIFLVFLPILPRQSAESA